MIIRSGHYGAIAILLCLVHAATAVRPDKPVPKQLAAGAPLPPALLSLTTKVSQERLGRPLPEVLEQLSEQTGQTLKAAREYTSQKVSVLYTELPAPQALQSLAAAVDGVWVQVGDAQAFRLEPSDRRRTRLDRFRKERHTAEETADRELLDRLKREIAQAGARDLAPDPAASVRSNPRQLQNVLRIISENQWRQVIAEGNESITNGPGSAGPDKTPGVILPLAWLPARERTSVSEFLRAVHDEAINSGAPPAAVEGHVVFAVRPESLRVEVWRLRAQGHTGIINNLYVTLAGGAEFHQDFMLSGVVSRATEDPIEPDTALIPPGIAAADINGSRETDRISEIVYGPARLDRAFIEIARAAHINVAMEYYTTPGIVPLFVQRGTLKEALARTESHPLVRFWSGPVLVVRPRDWTARHDREPPTALIDRWDHEAKHEGAILLNAYLDAAVMANDRQLSTLFGHGDDSGRLIYRQEAVKLLLNRFVLRGYRSLSSSQRRLAEQPSGLLLTRLSNKELAAWRPVLNRFPYLPSEAFQNLRLRAVHPQPRNVLLPRFSLLGIPGIEELPLVSESGP